MFIFSFKASKTKLAAAAAIIAAIVLSAVTIFGRTGQTAASRDGAVNYRAADASQRAAFLEGFGWKISGEPAEVREIIIPENFADGYEEYALINKEQGLDLEPYKGLRVKRWTYGILNYPGFEGTDSVRADLLIYDGRVIGGDVHFLEPGGFLHGFDMPEQTPSESTSQ